MKKVAYLKAVWLLVGVWGLADGQNTAVTLYQNQQAGEATYFQESLFGNCSISPTLPAWGDLLTYHVALSPTQYSSGDSSGGCGVCLQGTYLGTGNGTTPPPNTFTALVVDQCPGCNVGDLDLADDTGDGRWDISWQAIDCPVGNDKLAYLLQGSNPFFIKVGVRNHRIAPKSVQIKSQTNAAYVMATRTSDNFFTCTGCPTPHDYPMPIRILGINGQVIDDLIPALTNDVLQTGVNNQQFLSINDLIFVDGFEDLGF
ncbi:MAG: hypothetical protein R3E90_09560 [Marinicella sp.]|nr:hypothetical protein [Xanthomonadales bacterium]